MYRAWKQPRCSYIGEWLDKYDGYSDTLKYYYVAIKGRKEGREGNRERKTSTDMKLFPGHNVK